MRTKYLIAPLALALLVTAAARTGFFFADGKAQAQAVSQNPIQGPGQRPPNVMQPVPGAATGDDPGGYCCIPPYAYNHEGQCFVGEDGSGDAIYYTEDECETGVEIDDNVFETGILWNGDQSLCNFYCGEALGLHGSSASSESSEEAFTCDMCESETIDSCEGHPECEWIGAEMDGATELSPARCAPNPDAVDEDGYYLCDFSYGCCKWHPAGDPSEPNYDPDIGAYSYLFGYSMNGDYFGDFTDAKACVDADPGNAWMSRWGGVPDGDAATGYSFSDGTGTDSIDDFREECEAVDGGGSSSSASSESAAAAKENLYCDRRLMPTTVTDEIQCWLRDKSSVNQSPLWGTVFFTTVFYSDRPLDADGVAPLGRTIPDPVAGDQCEDRCWTAMDYGACCIDPNVEYAEDSCKGMTVTDCESRGGVTLPFTQFDSPECQGWAAAGACWVP